MSDKQGTGAVFFDSYADCRAAFLAAAKDIGAQRESFVHPTLSGRDNEELAIDVALAGPVDAKRLLVLCSGTHGFEGFAGSAMQLDAMQPPGPHADDIAVLLVHGVNPYGWSHGSRTNENQVDLNRNFVDFSSLPDEHPLAGDIQRISKISTLCGPDFAGIGRELGVLAATHGQANVSDALQRGQYFDPNGVGYGGARAEWSNTILRQIWERYFSGRSAIGIIDWHTGLGQYGEPVFLCFDAPGTESHRLAVSWWGGDKLQAADQAYQSGTRPNYSGLLLAAALEAARAHDSKAAGAVVEFGTWDPMEALKCLSIDRWLRNLPADADADSARQLRLHAARFFYPNEAEWNHMVLENGRRVVRQALDGLRKVQF